MINQSNIDSYNIYSSNNENIKKVLRSNKDDYPKLSYVEYNALIVLAGESLKIDETKKQATQKLKECDELGVNLRSKIFGGVSLEFFKSNCREFFK